MKHHILFVCLGNICRSPAAEGIMRAEVEHQGLQSNIYVDSAGTYAGHTGDLLDTRMRAAAARRGYSLTHRARQITLDDFLSSDMVIVMDDMNYERVHRMAPSPEAVQKIFRMSEFFPSRFADRTYVPDPYYEGAEGFELVLDMLEGSCQNIIDYTKRLELQTK